MEVREDHGSSVTRRGRKRVVKGVSAEQYRQINEFSLSEQSKSWSAFGTEPMTYLLQSVQYGIVNTETNLGRPRVMFE